MPDPSSAASVCRGYGRITRSTFNFKHHKSRAELKTRILRLLAPNAIEYAARGIRVVDTEVDSVVTGEDGRIAGLCTTRGGPTSHVYWCFPLLPGVLLVDSDYCVGPMYAGGGVKVVLYYGIGSTEALHIFCSNRPGRTRAGVLIVMRLPAGR